MKSRRLYPLYDSDKRIVGHSVETAHGSCKATIAIGLISIHVCLT